MLAKNVAAWFEIPTLDLDRAARFYESVLGVKLQRESMGSMRMAIFPHQAPDHSGAVVVADGYRPATEGTVVYLNLAQDLAGALARVEQAGGKVLLGKTALPGDQGFFAQFLDGDGNRVGLYSVQ